MMTTRAILSTMSSRLNRMRSGALEADMEAELTGCLGKGGGSQVGIRRSAERLEQP